MTTVRHWRAATGSDLETVMSGTLPDGLAPVQSGKRMLRIWPAAVSLALSSFTSVLLFPFFTYVPMTDVFGVMQPSVSFASDLRRFLFFSLPIAPADAIWWERHSGTVHRLACSKVRTSS